MQNIEEILFGCVKCANGSVMNKNIQEPFVVTLNRKVKNTKFVSPPPLFAKTQKTEIDLKIEHIF